MQVNGIRIHGMNRINVVMLLKKLSQNVYIVVARQNKRQQKLLKQKCQVQKAPSPQHPAPSIPPNEFVKFNNDLKVIKPSKDKENLTILENININLNMNMNDNSNRSINRLRSMSLEPVSKYRIWWEEVVSVELEKADMGLGFSVIDYKVSFNKDFN